MKKLFSSLLSYFIFSAFALQAQTNTNFTVTLAWGFPASAVTTDMVFVISHETNSAAPFFVLTNLPATNTNSFQVTVPRAPGVFYESFMVQASNYAGVSPGPVVTSPPPPVYGFALTPNWPSPILYWPQNNYGTNVVATNGPTIP